MLKKQQYFGNVDIIEASFGLNKKLQTGEQSPGYSAFLPSDTNVLGGNQRTVEKVHPTLSVSGTNILCQTFSMRNLTATLCLTIDLLLGSSGVSWSQDFQKGFTAYKSGDYATALRELTPFAKQGDAFAQFGLGIMYEQGQGVPQDYKTAVKWYIRAAEQGITYAQVNLGLMYRQGKGVTQDNVYAHMRWNIAASSADNIAIKKRDIVAKRMTPADLSTAQKLARECVRKNYKGC